MANVVYPKCREAHMRGEINLISNDIRAIIIDAADYTYAGTHEFLSSVPAAARVGTSPALSSKTVTDGTFDAADVTVTSVSGDPSEAVIVYQHTGSDATARLLAYIDTQPDGSTPISLTPSGGNVLITWPPAGIYSI